MSYLNGDNESPSVSATGQDDADSDGSEVQHHDTD